MEGLLSGGRDHAVGLFGQELLRVLSNNFSSVRVAGEGSVFGHVSLDSFDIETIRVMNGGVVLDDSGDLTTVLLDKLGGPVAYSTEALDNEGLASDSEGKMDTVSEGLGVKELTDGIVDTKTGGLGSACNTTLGDELASAAAFSIDILLTLHLHVGVLDPGHGLLVGAHVGSKAINLSTDKALLDELHGVLTGGSLNLSLRILPGVNLDSTLGTTERNVGDGEFEGHERSEGLNFLEIDVLRVASTALNGELMGRVLGSVASDSLEVTVVSSERNVESHDGLAGLDEVQVFVADTSHLGCVVVKELDLLEETRLVVLIDLGSELGTSGEVGRGCSDDWALDSAGSDLGNSLHFEYYRRFKFDKNQPGKQRIMLYRKN